MKFTKYFLTATGICFISMSVVGRAEDQQPAPSGTSAATPKAAAEEIPQGGIEVLRMVLSKDVKDREPDQEITTAKVGDVVVGWTQVRSGMGEVTITHRWLHETENLGDVPLAVKSSPWRTWSRKTLSEAGNWKWQVLNSQGKVLKEESFTVTP